MKKSIFKKLGGLFLGLAMSLGVVTSVAEYASTASETRASDVTHTAEVTSFTSSSIPSGWQLTGATFNSSYYKMSKGATVTVLASTLFKTGNVLSTDMTINIACGTFGTWSGGKNITFNYDFLDESGNSISNATFTTGGLNSTQGTYRGDKVLNKPTDPSAIYKLKITFSTFTTGDTARFAGIKLTYTETAGVVPPSVDSYTIHFANGDGTGSMSDATCDITKAYTIPNCEFTKEGYDFVDWIGSDNVHYNVGSTLLADRFAKDAEFTLTANWAVSTSVKDKITSADLAATNTNYTNFSNVTKNTAVYAGNSAQNTSGSNKRIQLRSQSPSGIVSTTSGGKIKKVIFGDNSDFNGKTITVYGKNSSYTDGSDLYNTSKAGTSLGTISNDGTITVSGDYTYVGVKASGAAYLGSITFVWEPIATHTVTISGGASSMYEGGTTLFIASCDQDGCEALTWESSDPTVASVSSSGKVVGLKAGTTTISATCAEGGSDSVSLTVQANALTLSPASISDAQKGGTGSITASLSGVSGETVSYVWESDQPSIVSVTGNAATASLSYINGGTATITCTATVNDIEFSNTCSVTVLSEDPTASFDNPPTEGWTGMQYDFTAVSANIDNGTWSWKVNGQDFTFDDDVDDEGYSIRYATFSEAGSYTITATCTGDGDATATATATIVITASSSVLTIDKDNIEIAKNGTATITPTLVVTGSYANSTTISVTKTGGVTLSSSTTTSGNAITVTAGNSGGVASVTFAANGQEKTCSIIISSTTTDTIVWSDTQVTSYSEWNNVSKNSEAVYGGFSTKSSKGFIQLKAKDYSGIWTTESGGIIHSASLVWSTETTAERTVKFYGKDSAYQKSDMPNTATDLDRLGTELGSIVSTGVTTSTEFEGSFKYVCAIAVGGALYLENITFTWIEPTPVESITAGQESVSVAKGATSQLTWTVLPANASNKAVDISMNPVLTGVEISDSGLISVSSEATVGAQTTITIASKENSQLNDTIALTIEKTHLDGAKVLKKNGFVKFTTDDSFESKRSSSDYLTAQYIDGTEIKLDKNSSLWSNVKLYVNTGSNESPVWEEHSMSAKISLNDNGKTFKFVLTEDGYSQSSNTFTIAVDKVTIKSELTMYWTSNASLTTHDFTSDSEYSATGPVTWSVVDAYSKASITQSGLLTIEGAPTSNKNSMQFKVRAVVGDAKAECTVTLVCEAPTSISVDWQDTIAHNATGTFTAAVETSYAKQAVNWASSNIEVLTVTGQTSNKLKATWVTAELEEDAKVTVTAYVDTNDNDAFDQGELSVSKEITIHAAEIPVTEVNITEDNIEVWQDGITKDETFQLHSTVTTGASVQKTLWSIVEGSDNVIVSSGNIYEGLSKTWKYTGEAGVATIRATSMNQENVQVYDEITVTVKQTVLASIAVNADADTIVKEFATGHELTASDYEGVTVTATYQSGNPADIAISDCSFTCDTSKAGSSTVVASYTLNGVTKTASYGVTIVDKVVTSLDLTVGVTSSYKVGDTLDLSNVSINVNYNIEEDDTIEAADCDEILLKSNGYSATTHDGYVFVDQDVERLTEIEFSYGGKTVSQPISVTEDFNNQVVGEKRDPIEAIPGNDSWDQITGAPIDASGNIDWSGTYAMVCLNSAGDYIYDRAITSDNNQKTNVSISKNKITSAVSDSQKIVIEKFGTGYSIKLSDNTYLTGKTTNDNGTVYSTSQVALSISWTSSGLEVTCSTSSVTNYLRANYNNGTPLFRFYKTSSKTTGTAVTLFKYNHTEGTPGDPNHTASYTYHDEGQALAFARKYLHRLVSGTSEAGISQIGSDFYYENINGTITKVTGMCEYNGSTSTASLTSLWSEMKTAYNNMGAESKGMLAYVEGKQDGNSLERFAYLYDHIVATHGMEEFINRGTPTLARLNPIVSLNEVDNSVWVISAVALVGLTAIGGYFFYCKRKEI